MKKTRTKIRQEDLGAISEEAFDRALDAMLRTSPEQRPPSPARARRAKRHKKRLAKSR